MIGKVLAFAGAFCATVSIRLYAARASWTYGAGSLMPLAANPRSLNWQLSQLPHASPAGVGS